jgi:hypothetical protein
MTLLAREIITALASEISPEEILRKFSDPYWFQALGCVLGFDWHSSGLTTTVLGAAKEGIKGPLKRESRDAKKTWDSSLQEVRDQYRGRLLMKSVPMAKDTR